MMSKPLGVVFLLASLGCFSAKYEDFSHEARYAGLVGETYRTAVELVVHGVTADKNYNPVVDYYVVTEKPGFGGPEVVSQKRLPPGSLIRINGFLRCTKCLGSSERIRISIETGEEYSGATVLLKDVGNMTMVEADGTSVAMNPMLFEPE